MQSIVYELSPKTYIMRAPATLYHENDILHAMQIHELHKIS